MVAKRLWLLAAFFLIAAPALAAAAPAVEDGVWIAPEFRFHTGETLSGCACTTPRRGMPEANPC